MNSYQKILNFQLRERAKRSSKPITSGEMLEFERRASSFANQNRAPLSDEQLFELFQKQFGQSASDESARSEADAPGNGTDDFQPKTRAGKILKNYPGIYGGV